MGKHSKVQGEASTAAANGMKGTAGKYTGKHRGEAGSDLPPRDKNIKGK